MTVQPNLSNVKKDFERILQETEKELTTCLVNHLWTVSRQTQAQALKLLQTMNETTQRGNANELIQHERFLSATDKNIKKSRDNRIKETTRKLNELLGRPPPGTAAKLLPKIDLFYRPNYTMSTSREPVPDRMPQISSVPVTNNTISPTPAPMELLTTERANPTRSTTTIVMETTLLQPMRKDPPPRTQPQLRPQPFPTSRKEAEAPPSKENQKPTQQVSHIPNTSNIPGTSFIRSPPNVLSNDQRNRFLREGHSSDPITTQRCSPTPNIELECTPNQQKQRQVEVTSQEKNSRSKKVTFTLAHFCHTNNSSSFHQNQCIPFIIVCLNIS